MNGADTMYSKLFLEPSDYYIKNYFQGDFLGGWLMMESAIYWRDYGTLGRKNTHPFADFSYKTVIFKRLEKYLKFTQNSSFVHQLLILLGDTSQ